MLREITPRSTAQELYPDRLAKQLTMMEMALSSANEYGIDIDTYAFGSLACPELREHRFHDDVDLIVLDIDNHLGNMQVLHAGLYGQGWRLIPADVLEGSSLSKYQHPNFTQEGLLSVRHLIVKEINGIKCATHILPDWVRNLLNQMEIVIPMSAFSTDQVSFGTTNAKRILSEYLYLIKSQTHVAKDQIDVEILLGTIDRDILKKIEADIADSGQLYLLPQPLVEMIRSAHQDGLSPLVQKSLHQVSI